MAVATRDAALDLAILEEAKAGGFLEDDIPTDEEAVTEAADYWIEEAQKAYDAGMNDNATVLSILKIAGVDVPDPEPEAETPSESASTPAAEPELAADDAEEMDVRSKKERAQDEEGIAAAERDDSLRDTYPRRSSGGLSEADEREALAAANVAKAGAETKQASQEAFDEDVIVAVATRHNLPLPKDWEDDPTVIPRDLTTLSELELRALHGEYATYYAVARTELGKERIKLMNLISLLEDFYRTSLLHVDPINDITGKPKTVSMVEAEAKDNDDYRSNSSKVRAQEARVESFKALSDMYSRTVDVLSRDWTMRREEWEMTK